MAIDLTPNNITLIPLKDKIEVIDVENDPSLGLGARVGGLGGTSASAVSDAINNEGNLVTDIINARLDSEAKTILGEFTFGASGAIKMITDADNGLWFSPTGILAKKSGANTLTATNAGDVTMVGTITASAGSIGGWNISATALYYDGATDDLSAGMASADYPFYAGKKYANRATAPFRVIPTGVMYATGAVIDGTSTIAGITGTQIGYVATSTADIVPTGLAYSTGGISTGSDGSQSAYVVLTWNAISSNTFDHYLIRYKKAALTYYTYIPATTNTITIEGLTPNISYNFGVASINKYGTSSAFSADISQTTASDTTAPATVTAGSATAGIQYIILEWTHNTESDLASYNIYRNTANNSATAILIGNCRTNYFVDGGRTGDQIYYYWVKAVDTSGNVSASFSIVASATPRNVESTDVTEIAATKILIDGVVYLSNWRKTGDLTMIDGGSISTNTVTLSQLNFTPVQTNDVIASINASAEGITIDADNITISGSTTFASGYNPTGRVLAVGGTYDSAASGARVRIFPDANTGIQVIDDATNDVFKALVGGTNVGDVIIGNYAGGQGIFYDKSSGITTFAGSLSAAAGTLGVITTGLITLDATGYIRGGQTAYNTGDPGFFLGYDTDAYKFSIGNPAGTYMIWDGVVLTIKGGLIANEYYRISSDIYYSDDGEESTLSTTYVKLKEFTLPSNFPECSVRIYFELDRAASAGAGKGKIYKNGVAYGTERNAPTDWTGFTEDLTFKANDLIQLYLKGDPSYGVQCRYFRILGTIAFDKYNITTTG